MFKKLQSSVHNNRQIVTGDNYVKIYNKVEGSKGRTAMAVIISKELCALAKIKVGERFSIHLVEDDRKKKWLLIERDPDGSKLSALNAGKHAPARSDYQRSKLQVRALDWMERHIVVKGHEPRSFRNDTAKVQEGAIAFPLEVEKQASWFQGRG